MVFRSQLRMDAKCEDICSSHFSCEKQISSHPSEAAPGFSDGATTSMTNFFLSVIYPKYFYYITYSLSLRERARSFVFALFYRRPWHIPPPCPKSEKTRWVSGGSRQKGYRRVAGVSARRSDPAATRKAHGITSKTHLLSPGAPSRCT
jgi:hypothetical protein